MKNLLTLLFLISIVHALTSINSEDSKIAKKFKYENASLNMYWLATE